MPLRALATLFLGLVAIAASPAAEITSEQEKFFESKIRPVLIKECYGCHSNNSGNAKGGLKLDTRQLTLIGGSSGPAIVPGDLDESLLFNAIIHEDFVMPPKRKLSDDVIADFRRWIEMGAPDPRETKISDVQSTIGPDDIQDAKENFWAYKQPKRSSVPAVQDAGWAVTDVDHFVLATLEDAELKPAGDAQAYQVLRRLCFDLVGLPPTPEQIAYFESMASKSLDRAIAHVTDRLLEQQQFGERWGRHWLDVARYAESTGREVNMTYPHAWRYRDYVIDAFNADKPFSDFVQEQIAGDLLPAKSDEQWASNLVATTFLAMGPKNINEQNATQFAADLVDEQIDATTQVFLGTSVACARCHDHKFDPIPQTDYYALAGIFRSTKTYFGNPPSEFGAYRTAQAKRPSSLIVLPVDDPSPYDKRYSEAELARLREEIADKRQQLVALRPDRNSQANSIQTRLRLTNEIANLSAKLSVVDEDGKPRSYCMGVQDRDRRENARVLVRGEIDQPGQVVASGFPQVLCSTSNSIKPKGSGRLELAKWMGSDDNPLTARVYVNRVWQHLFGQAIVPSTENFGSTGQAPSHPELLDTLAVDFVENGWSTKKLIRKLVTSRIYRISSTYDEKSFQKDPDNRLLWRANPRRVDAEALRDAMLAISGEIETKRPRGSEVAKAGYVRVRAGTLGDTREIAMEAGRKVSQELFASMRENAQSQARQRPGAMRGGGRFGQRGNSPRGNSPRGRGFMQPGMTDEMRRKVTDEVQHKIQSQLDMEEAKFRSVYLPIVRDELPRSLEVFDFADANTFVGTREVSNTPNQALYLMNNRFVSQQADAFARRLKQLSSSPTNRIALAFELAYGRPPTSGERRASQDFFRSYAKESSSDPTKTLAAFCQSLFASAEFRYID